MAAILVTNATPGGPVSPAVYSPPAVVIPVGAAVSTGGGSTLDSKKVTFSGWFYVAAGAIPAVTGTLDRIALYLFNRIGDTEENATQSGIFLHSNGKFSVLFFGQNIPAINNKPPWVSFSHITSPSAAELFVFDAWNHIFLTADLDADQNAKTAELRVNGSDNVLNLAAETDSYPEGEPHVRWDINLTVSQDGPVGVLPGDITVNNDPPSVTWYRQAEVWACNVMVWHGQFINPTTGTSVYSAKEGQSYIIRGAVEYANSRGVNPVHALAAMWIETKYGTFGDRTAINGRKNLYQFKQRTSPGPYPVNDDPYYLTLGYQGTRTDAEDQYTAFCNAWTGFKTSLFSGARVPLPNDYPRVVRNATGATPEPYQLYLVHVLGGSTGVTSQVNADNLLRAMVADDTRLLSTVGASISNMTGQSSIWGSDGPDGLFTLSHTVAQAIDTMELVWAVAEAEALTRLDAGTNTNLRQFRDGDGYPMPTTVAVEKFGFPTFWYSGAAEEFVVNAGSGGTATVTGTISDAVSGPRP